MSRCSRVQHGVHVARPRSRPAAAACRRWSCRRGEQSRSTACQHSAAIRTAREGRRHTRYAGAEKKGAANDKAWHAPYPVQTEGRRCPLSGTQQARSYGGTVKTGERQALEDKERRFAFRRGTGRRQSIAARREVRCGMFAAPVKFEGGRQQRSAGCAASKNSAAWRALIARSMSPRYGTTF